MSTYFQGNTYFTPDNNKASVWDYILLRSRLYFYFRVLKSIFKFNRKYASKGLYTYERWEEQSFEIFNICESCGGRIEIRGLDNIRKIADDPVVFIGNHMGLLETMILPCIIDPIKRVTFVIKQSLTELPFFGNIMNSTDPIVVGRENPREDLMKVITDGVEKLSKNLSIILFPQSTRMPIFDKKKFNSLGIKLAKRGNAKVIPFAIKTDFLGQGKLIKDFGKLKREKTVYITFGEPLTIEGNGKPEHEETIKFISENLKKWGAEVV